MATVDSVKAKIRGLIALANTKTGNHDTDLTTAVNALIAGFGQGVGDAGGLGRFLYKFGVLSDVHTTYGDGVSKIKNAITVLQNLGAEFISCAGDLVSGASISELQTHSNAVAEVATIPFYSCNGNHDIGLTDNNWNTYVGHPLDYVMERDGDVFIFFSLTSSSGYGQTKLQWLQEQFDTYKGSRILLFMHYPLYGYSGLRPETSYGFSTSSTEDDSILSAMIANKNVMQFSGHTHFLFDVEETFDNINVIQFNFADCATIHIPSSNYPRRADNTAIETGASQGYMATAYQNGIVLKAVDFITGEYMDGYEYILPFKNHQETPSAVIIASTSSINIDEGDNATFTVKLNHQPSENVVLHLTTDANNAITLDKTELTFTPDNYDVEQTVVITSNVDEDYLDVNSAITISGYGYTAKIISVTVMDTDKAPVTLVSISAVYSGGLVAPGTDATDLTGVVVTGIYSDGSTETLSGYTLSGEINEGENTITVTYNGLTTTFTVVANMEGSDGYLVWENRSLDKNGIYHGTSGFCTQPFAVTPDMRLLVAVDSEIGGASSPYVYFYSTSNPGTDAMLNRVGLTAGFVNTVIVPSSAIFAMIRSTDRPNATLDTIGSLIYLQSEEELVSISVEYTGSEAVSIRTDLTELNGIAVTGTYSSGLEMHITDYTMSGSISVGVNVITVTYHGLTATFTVNGFDPNSVGYSWKEGYINSAGNLIDSDLTYYYTSPIDVIGKETIEVTVNSEIGGESNVYVFFYRSEEINSASFVIRYTMVNGQINTVNVPEGATHVVARSTGNPNATVDTIRNYIHVSI